MKITSVGLQITFSFFIPSFPFVSSVMICTKRTILGILHLSPLLLQLPEQIRREQSVFHKSIRQSVFHRVSDTFLSRLTFTAGQLRTGRYSTEDSPASSHLQCLGHGRFSGSDQAGDTADPLLDDSIQFLLDLSNHGSVREHIHEAVARDMTVRRKINKLWRAELHEWN